MKLITRLCIVPMLLVTATLTVAEVKFKVAGNAPPGTPWDLQWQRFVENVAADPKQELEPVLFIRGQLGSPDNVLATVRRGRVQIGGFPLAGAAAVVPELSILLAPFLFDSYEEADFVMDNYLLAPYQELFEQKGLVMFQWLETGWNNLYGKRALVNIEDVDGYRMRVLPTKASQLFLSSLDADMVPLPFTEVLTALQTGLVDGGETSAVIYLASGISDNASHLTMTRHAFDSGVIVANKRWFDRLSPAQQQTVSTAIGDPNQLRSEVRGMLQTMLEKKAADNRVVIHELSPEQREAWRAHTQAQHQELVKSIGGQAQTIYDLIQEGKRSFRALAE